MTDLFAARSQMAVSLGFHIIFAAIGVGLPALMLLSHALWYWTGRESWLRLTRAWSKGLAVFFAVGAVSGTVLSFELGLLWPRFMEVAGPLVAERQPAKLAAMEAHFETGPCAPLRLGGLPDVENRTVPWSLEIPCGLSLLVGRDPNTVVTGLEDIPRDEWPPVTPVHIAFQIMVGIGTFLALLGVWGLWRLLRRRPLWEHRWYLWALVAAGPLAFVAIQAGWTVTEVGRQPWVIYGIMRTADAVTPMPGLVVPFTTFTVLYLFLGVVVIVLMKRITDSQDEEDVHAPQEARR